MEDTPAVELHRLTKRFGSLTAVDHLDLVVPRGQVLALLGPNGAGKSTTTEMILGLARPDEGEVRVLGLPAARAQAEGRIGAMLQNGHLLGDVPVRRMLRLLHGMHAHPLAFDEMVELAEVGELLPMNTDRLSGGQAQRVRFAIGIMGNPEVLLLDEPTVAMDVETRRRFWGRMRGFAADGRTVVFATHYLEEADEFAERVVVMAHGRIVADGTGSQIKQQVVGRTLSFASSASLDWATLPGVDAVTPGQRIELHSTDSDATVRALVLSGVQIHDLEVTSPSLEDAFIRLTTAAQEN